MRLTKSLIAPPKLNVFINSNAYSIANKTQIQKTEIGEVLLIEEDRVVIMPTNLYRSVYVSTPLTIKRRCYKIHRKPR